MCLATVLFVDFAIRVLPSVVVSHVTNDWCSRQVERSAPVSAHCRMAADLISGLAFFCRATLFASLVRVPCAPVLRVAEGDGKK